MAPIIETPRLLLRQWRESDRGSWADMCADPRVMEFLGPTREQVRALADADLFSVRLEQNAYGWWAVELKQAALFVGVIALQDVPFAAHFTPALEVGWRLSAEHWGRGYATEGAQAAIAYAFEELDRAQVVAITAKINLRSQRVMQRLGMTRDLAGDFENPRVAQQSPLRPSVLYRIRRV